jgi:hypothetical protein
MGDRWRLPSYEVVAAARKNKTIFYRFCRPSLCGTHMTDAAVSSNVP